MLLLDHCTLQLTPLVVLSDGLCGQSGATAIRGVGMIQGKMSGCRSETLLYSLQHQAAFHDNKAEAKGNTCEGWRWVCAGGLRLVLELIQSILVVSGAA